MACIIQAIEEAAGDDAELGSTLVGAVMFAAERANGCGLAMIEVAAIVMTCAQTMGYMAGHDPASMRDWLAKIAEHTGDLHTQMQVVAASEATKQ